MTRLPLAPHVPGALAALLAASCSALAPNTPQAQAAGGSLTAGSPFYGDRYAVSVRAIAYEDYEESDAGLGDNSINSETDVEGWGLEAEIVGGGGPALILGAQEREYGNDEEAQGDELYSGVKFYLGDDRIVPYAMANLRYGAGLEFKRLDPVVETDSYFGYGVGFGAVLLVTSRFFVDVRIGYEDTFEAIQISGSGAEIDLSGWVGSIGAGFSF